MSKTYFDLIREHQLRQESQRLAEEAIEHAAGPKHHQGDDRLGYLVTYFGKRSDLPENAKLCKMLPDVVRNLAAAGLHEPVSLHGLVGKWWLSHVDAAYENPRMETGCAMITVIASTDELLRRYSDHYCEVLAGPFDRPEDSIECFFIEENSRSYRDPNARYCGLPSWSMSRLEKSGRRAPIPFSALAGKYWVCGMSGGVWKTEDIEHALQSGSFGFHITDGPFDSQDDADYAFDVMWESPE